MYNLHYLRGAKGRMYFGYGFLMKQDRQVGRYILVMQTGASQVGKPVPIDM